MVPITRTCSLIVAAAVTVSGAVGAGATPAAAGDLSAYLRARAAEASGDAAAAAADYARALAMPPVDAGVAARAYRAGLLAGDEALAARAAAALTALGVAPADAALIPLGRAAAAGDGAGIAAAAATLGRGPLAMLVPAVDAWAGFAAGRGVVDAPPPALDPPARRLLAEARVLLLIAAGRSGDGIAALEALGGGRAPLDLRIAAAQLLFGRGEAAAARRLIAGDDAVLARLRDGAAARPTLGFGVSRLLARLGAELSRDETAPVAIALHRAALRADPGNDRARLLLADRLAGEDAPELALATLAAVPADAPFAPAAAEARVGLLVEAGRPDAALAAARTLATAAGAGVGAWEIYAERLAAGGDRDGAVAWFSRAVAGEGAGDWTAWSRLGNALDEAGRWPEAKRALARAVAVAPDQPLALNNLGYALAVHGERAAGLKALRRAHAMAPGDSSIADSLGWALHLTGDSAAALPLIEAAAADQPGNAEVAAHLGDVYWALGRRFEARYAWVAARAVGATGLDERIAR